MAERADRGSSDTVRVGLNGFGRIGRNVFRAAVGDPRVEIVGINDVMDAADMVYLAKYDSVAGRLDGVELDDGTLRVDGVEVPLFGETDPAALPWDERDVDVAMECTGLFRTYEDASAHNEAGAGTTIISAPPKGDREVLQVVYGVNESEYDGDDVVSNASCTTNSVAPVAKVLHETFGVEAGLLTTVHSYTGTQNLVDGPSGKIRRGRAAAENLVPTSTGAAQATTVVVPELEGRLDGMAVRVPTPNGSLTDLTVSLDADADAADVNEAFRAAAEGPLAGVLGVTDDPIVSRDVLGDPHSSLVDAGSTMALPGGDLVKVLTWYDNEYGFACRMIDLAAHVT